MPFSAFRIMTSPLNEREIFCTALEIEDREERSGYLDRVCESDPALRMFGKPPGGASPGRGLLNAFPAGANSHISASEQPGTKIGPYVLARKLGEGNFGVVWAADQVTPVLRRVAVKVIKPGLLIAAQNVASSWQRSLRLRLPSGALATNTAQQSIDSRAIIAGFERERQALAAMDHPSIARILDVGATDNDRPYFAMEYIDGEPITLYCQRNRSPLPQRLQLFVQVCRAVEHAHQKGIVHQDIKPQNVLVTTQDGFVLPKVIDFGIATAIQEPGGREPGSGDRHPAFGTLPYMSPEQLSFGILDIDTRADIYALGVLLYELLTGSPPFDLDTLKGQPWDHAIRLLRDEVPVPPIRTSTRGPTA